MKAARLVFATGNEGKMREIREIMEGSGYEILSMKEAGAVVDPEENGSTFGENALIKARALAEILPEDIVMADDSGLVIDVLNGEPGIYSARYMGRETPYSEKNAELIRRVDAFPEDQRTARYVCAIAAILPGGKELLTEGTLEGVIAHEQRGTYGFGYDPIFYVPELGCTTGEIPETEKNKISHRGRALEMMKAELEKEEV
ncbi:MAG: RdgB/HAM1 family non-canonical purine NTP pyrophosphatase [Lachnospiraceae bacterium]|nr:RdgB/HAM1 family non-canonical purine NTP pyrophosphatase [Lachnospiraceae bacterium]